MTASERGLLVVVVAVAVAVEVAVIVTVVGSDARSHGGFHQKVRGDLWYVVVERGVVPLSQVI